MRLLGALLPFVCISASAAVRAPRPPPLLQPRFDEQYTVGGLPTRGPVAPESELRIVDTVLPLKRGNASSISSIYVQALRAQAAGRRPEWSRVSTGVSPLYGIDAGTVFLAPVTVGGQDFYTVVDTGSSDPWLVGAGFSCYDPYDGTAQTEDYCYFGPVYDPSQSTTYTPIPNQNLNLSYADGETINGLMGFESYTLGGITVPQQEFGVVNYAAWNGDGDSSGLIGFAYRTLTSAYVGTDPKADQKGHALNYNTLFQSMYASNLTAPVFSIAMSRDPMQAGVLALGGIPDVPHSPYFVSVPIKPVGVNASSGEIVYEFYTVVIDGFAFSSTPNAQFNPYNTPNSLKTTLSGNGTNVIIDSGTSLLYLPPSIAKAVNSLFTPPGTYNSDTLTWEVDCAAIPPTFGVSIGQKVFYVNAADMILQNGPDTCISGAQSNLGGPLTIIGDVWMKNVLVVFDLGAEVMRFAAREFYGMSW